ncbi:MAG: tetratricopeptide repeat protein, partial [Candidatus Latescibacteria bacterium]|nr:tetratricopeptide repeat protein [Candidatus Latescibacterota bacterium]
LRPSPSHPLSPSGGTGEEVSPPPPSASFEQGYREALKQYESGHYQSAILAFRELLSATQENSLSDNCRYWLGECYYSLREFQQAIAQFRKVFSYKNSNKRDAAQLKIGMSYLELRDKTKAREELSRLIEDYPNSQYADRARLLLKGL